jgi:transposase
MQPAASLIRPLTIEQTPARMAHLRSRLQASGIAPADILIVIEATGSDWISLATTLHQAGYAVSVINPMQADHCAKALLRPAKTDAIDARSLAQLAAKLQPACWTPPPAV